MRSGLFVIGALAFCLAGCAEAKEPRRSLIVAPPAKKTVEPQLLRGRIARVLSVAKPSTDSREEPHPQPGHIRLAAANGDVKVRGIARADYVESVGPEPSGQIETATPRHKRASNSAQFGIPGSTPSVPVPSGETNNQNHSLQTTSPPELLRLPSKGASADLQVGVFDAQSPSPPLTRLPEASAKPLSESPTVDFGSKGREPAKKAIRRDDAVGSEPRAPEPIKTSPSRVFKQRSVERNPVRPRRTSSRATAPIPAGAIPLTVIPNRQSISFRERTSELPETDGSIPETAIKLAGQLERDIKKGDAKQLPNAAATKTVSQVEQVGHTVRHNHSTRRSGDRDPTAQRAVHVTDLQVEELPTQPVRQAAGEGLSIPLLSRPEPENASIEGMNDLVTLVSTDADLRGVLRMIADYHKLNLVIGPDVSGPVTVSIRGATLNEVLDAILGVAGYHWHQSGNLLFVTGANGGSLDPRVQGRRLQVYPLDYVSSKDIEPVINGLLSPIGQSFVSESSDADKLKTRETLVVEDSEAGHTRVAQYLAQIDVPPAQVLIEAHILQIDLDDENRHGINLSAIARVAGARVTLTGANFVNQDVETPAATLNIDGTDMDSLIEAIRSQTNSRTLASPKVSVINRQLAKVQIGQRLPYSVSTTTQTATVQNVEFLDVGVVLTVTPVISDDGNILMTVLPKVSGGRITDSGFPEEDTTEVSTTVMVPDGGGLVIGGLIRESNTDSESRVPKLGQVPVIKHLFKRESQTTRRNELVVAMVTHIIRHGQAPRNHEAVELNQALPTYSQSELYYHPGTSEVPRPTVRVRR